MTDHSYFGKKPLTTCIYCSSPPNGEEHWLNRSLGKFAGNTLLTGRICRDCNKLFGDTVDLEVARTGHTGVFRQVLGIEGRKSHERKNAFDYKASELEPPIQVFRVNGGDLTPVLEQAVRRSPDGTLVATQGRLLVIATTDGEKQLRFPKGWNADQLRSAAETRGLLGGRPVSAHVPPPETVDQFVGASRDIIRAVFGPFEIDVYHTRLDGPVGPTEPTLLRFHFSPTFLRGVAKIAFHYFLWACPHIGGNEPEFSAFRAFVRHAIGNPSDFINTSDSLVERIAAEDGNGADCHVFASTSLGADLIAQAHFFTQPVGPAFPTFVVKLGRRPGGHAPEWRSMHVAAYRANIPGHDGMLETLLDGQH